MAVPLEQAEAARAVMLELFPEGFEERETSAGLELAAYTEPAGEAEVRRRFGRVRSEEVLEDWAEAWKRFHRPVRVGPLWIAPPWDAPDAGSIPVVIDPGRAFGTGGHPTTRLCLELLLEQPRSSVVDLGCGSGVLAIAAAKLGFGPVTALDSDPSALEAARRNARTNGSEVAIVGCDVLDDPLYPVELALVNIELQVIEALVARLPARRIIASGYLASERPKAPGWSFRDRREAGGWAADLLER